jgi:hypothetical protein
MINFIPSAGFLPGFAVGVFMARNIAPGHFYIIMQHGFLFTL